MVHTRAATIQLLPGEKPCMNLVGAVPSPAVEMAPSQRQSRQANFQEAPDFKLKSEAGEEVTLEKALDTTEKGIVLFVYPKANTPGCTKQACGFRDAYNEIQAKGFDVYGVSRDKESPQVRCAISKPRK